jgi:hypothetical protein
METAVPAGHAASAELGGPSWLLSVAFPLARRSGPEITQPWDPGQASLWNLLCVECGLAQLLRKLISDYGNEPIGLVE